MKWLFPEKNIEGQRWNKPSACGDWKLVGGGSKQVCVNKAVYPALHQWLCAKMTEQFREEIKSAGKTKCEGARLGRRETCEEIDV